MDGAVAVHPLLTEAAAPVGIAAGPDGALWFAEIATGQIGRITPDTMIVEFALPDRASRPHDITLGPDGALWAALETGALARITATPDPPSQNRTSHDRQVRPHNIMTLLACSVRRRPSEFEAGEVA
jgi:virginiamycin B lyase